MDSSILVGVLQDLGVDLLRKATRPSAPQVLRLLDAVVFNALIGNHDAHAKNFSLLYTGQSKNAAPTLAPLYDMLDDAATRRESRSGDLVR